MWSKIETNLAKASRSSPFQYSRIPASKPNCTILFQIPATLNPNDQITLALEIEALSKYL